MPPSPYHNHSPRNSQTQTLTTRLKPLLILFTSIILLYFLLSHTHISQNSATTTTPYPLSTPTCIHHLVFGIASSSNSFPKRQSYINTWFHPNVTRGYVFLDENINTNNNNKKKFKSSIPRLISHDTSHFPYTFRGGLRSAIRVTRIVKEIVELNLPNVRWYVFGDDDTVFFTDNLVKTLSKYDHNKWYYIGSNSESFEQNSRYSFEMAFGGGGIVISYPLAKVLAKVLDSCLLRYAHLYGSDSRIFSCLAELGVVLSHEPGFHQVDIRGNLFGLLSSHPLAPLVSLHHLDSVEPIFPGMNRTQALEQLFSAVKVDPLRVLQQTVCYDHSKSLTISISWGYSVQVFEGNQLLPDLLPVQRTFLPWKRSLNVNSNPFTFNVKELSRDSCQKSAIFFLENISSKTNEIQSNYSRQLFKKCPQIGILKDLEQIRVLSPKLDLDASQFQAQRRHCCDVLSSFDKGMEIGIRPCGDEELIFMTP
ncbi:hypothetical protein IFM89_014711 [Coptis chinensis]|uniref:Uncharacterized protein n=1 Tax=Coptis chinensis TaxID=261450 RepID=A0A835HEQ0_9MAGN|nr:hypothetical protein IFM89_014711 [Coptis chinensis]